MKPVINSFLVIIVLSFVQIKVVSQVTAINDSSYLKLQKAAREIMINAGNCALITLDSEGKSRVRTMDPFIPESDFIVWFGTNSNSRKVKQIKNDPRVTLYYFDNKAQGYVVISGTAKLVNELSKKEKYWKKEWKDYYTDKKDNYLLIQVIPNWLEVLSPAHGIYNNPDTWTPPVVVFDSK